MFESRNNCVYWRLEFQFWTLWSDFPRLESDRALDIGLAEPGSKVTLTFRICQRTQMFQSRV